MPGILRGVARTAVVAGTATAVSNRVSRRQAGRWAQQETSYAQAPAPAPAPVAPAPPAPAPPAMDQKLEQLQQLAALKEQGILTDDEFAAQKARILSG
ncbi:SHOCT domain-containing protein [Kitasatospora phosalacinea]|uniref:SHOCT domain-containing protein n=1 Tax=Kitasatospora phosalacinea TaxID=2065 RepID=UPI00365B877A